MNTDEKLIKATAKINDKGHKGHKEKGLPVFGEVER